MSDTLEHRGLTWADAGGHVRAASFKEEDRTVEIVWAAGAKVKRYSWDEGYYMEELSMDAAHIRMHRFANGMSVLDSHDAGSMDNRIGTVVPGSARVDGGKAYATVRISRNTRGEAVYQDLKDGHPFPVSVGYRIHAYEKHDGEEGQIPTLRAIDWEPMELSAVPIPADPGAHTRHEEQPVSRTAKQTDDQTAAPPVRRNTSITLRQLDGGTFTIEDPNELQRQSARIRPKAAARRSMAERYLGGYDNIDIDAFVQRTEGFNSTEVRHNIVELMVDEQERTASFPHIETRGMQDEGDTRRAAVSNAILHRYGVIGDDKLSAPAREWRGMDAMEIVKGVLRDSGQSDRGSRNEVLQRGLHSTSDFPAILGEVTRQTLVAGYASYENTFQLIANRNVVSDFREMKKLEIGNGPDLLPVNEHGEFKAGTVRESEESFKIGTFGRVFGLTRQMIINDQLGAFVTVIQNWGRQAAKLEGDIVWGVIINNAKLKSDNKALFHADHGNLGTAAALSLDALKAARTMFRKQKDIDGQAINVAPKYLFVGSDLEIEAQTILSGPSHTAEVAKVVPEAIKSITPVYEHRLDQISATAWLLFAAAQETMGRGLQFAHLDGQEQPFFDEQIGFDVDGIRYKIRHDFGAGLTDYRFAYKNAGQ